MGENGFKDWIGYGVHLFRYWIASLIRQLAPTLVYV